MDGRLRLLAERLNELGRRDVHGLMAAGLVVALAAGMGFGLGSLIGHAAHRHAAHPVVTTVRVPDLVGRASATAIALLHRARLGAQLQRMPMGDDRLIMWQDPAAGARVARGTVVVLQVRCLTAPCS